MKHFTLIVIVLTLGLGLIFIRKGELANIGPDGEEIEPLTPQEKLTKGLELTIKEIKEKINPAKETPVVDNSIQDKIYEGVPNYPLDNESRGLAPFTSIMAKNRPGTCGRNM